MKAPLQTLAIGAVAVAALAVTASAQTMEEHKIVSAQEIKWAPGPSSIPPGAEAATLYGDPSKEGLFALRLKLPKGYAKPSANWSWSSRKEPITSCHRWPSPSPTAASPPGSESRYS
jgi:hypothetical protein